MDLRENFNIFCVPIIYPYVQVGKLMVRLIPTATHTLEDVNYTVDAIAKVMENLKQGKYVDDTPIKKESK